MRTLQEGTRGPDVRAWQAFLQQRGFEPGAIDGAFGPQTKRATQAFQETEHLNADGVAGKETLGRAGALGLRTLRRLSNPEVTPTISAHAKRILSQHHQDAFGSEIPFDADGVGYVARIEEHFHPPGGALKPWGTPFRWRVFASLSTMKNCEPPVSLPACAMESDPTACLCGFPPVSHLIWYPGPPVPTGPLACSPPFE
jgi:hypothetical protein